MPSTPDPRPAKRVKDKDLMRRLHLEHGECVCCGIGYGLTLHHVKRKSQGGGDVMENLVFLCQGPGTSDCHGKLHSGDATVREAVLAYQAARTL